MLGILEREFLKISPDIFFVCFLCFLAHHLFSKPNLNYKVQGSRYQLGRVLKEHNIVKFLFLTSENPS